MIDLRDNRCKEKGCKKMADFGHESPIYCADHFRSPLPEKRDAALPEWTEEDTIAVLQSQGQKIIRADPLGFFDWPSEPLFGHEVLHRLIECVLIWNSELADSTMYKWGRN